MMGPFGIAMLAFFLLGALASWIVGAVTYARALPKMGAKASHPVQWVRMIVWPFALGRLRAASASDALIASRAMIVFVICMTLAVTTISLSTNLTRISK